VAIPPVIRNGRLRRLLHRVTAKQVEKRDITIDALLRTLTLIDAEELPRPRGVLREFGLELPDETEIRVWDSTAEVRYLVVPMRPLGTEGFSEERLAALVTRDSMIGTGLPKSPAEAP